jgi:hypothetical protein
MSFETHISGIPCLIQVHSYVPPDPHKDQGLEFDFDVLDRRGRKAPWLARKMTAEDVQRIEEEWAT